MLRFASGWPWQAWQQGEGDSEPTPSCTQAHPVNAHCERGRRKSFLEVIPSLPPPSPWQQLTLQEYIVTQFSYLLENALSAPAKQTLPFDQQLYLQLYN